MNGVITDVLSRKDLGLLGEYLRLQYPTHSVDDISSQYNEDWNKSVLISESVICV